MRSTPASLADRSRAKRRYILDRFRTAHGDKVIGTVRREHVERWISSKAATPTAALHLLVSLRELMRWSVRVGLRKDDPPAGVRRPRIRTDGFYPWSEDDIAMFEKAHPIGSRARLAFSLGLYTGQRRGDVIKMGRQHVQDGAVRVRQGKTGTQLVVPVHPSLQVALDAIPPDRMTFLTTRYGRPFTPTAFTTWFKGECRKAGLPKGASFHGLRKAAARRLAEAGCSTNIIAAITGHESLREIVRYTASAEQAHLARQGIEALVRQGKKGKVKKPPSRVLPFPK